MMREASIVFVILGRKYKSNQIKSFSYNNRIKAPYLAFKYNHVHTPHCSYNTVMVFSW